MDSGQLTVYRGCTAVVDAHYGRGNDRSPVEAIIDALATATGNDPMDLPPLYEYVDPDALEDLFERNKGTRAAETLLSFRFETWNVFVRADGRIRVCDATRPTDPEPVFGPGTA